MKYIKLFEEKYEYFDLMTMSSGELIELLKSEINKDNYDIEYIKEIIEWGHFNIDALWFDERNEQRSFLIKASILNKADIVKTLLDGGVDPNLKNKWGTTALMYAASNGVTQAVQELLKHPDIDPNIQKNDGWTALMLAAFNQNSPAVRELLSHPAIDITITNNNGQTAWDRASDEIRKQFPELNPLNSK